MKKVYMPTMDELYMMQDLSTGYNIYQYLLAKTIEKLIFEWKNNQRGSSLPIYQYLNENLIIAYSICRMYPELIRYSSPAQNDLILCQELISKGTTQDRTIYNLDNLSYFEDSTGVFSNIGVLDKTLEQLRKNLPNHPKYRFEYKQSTLLDNIFSGQISPMDISYYKSTIAQNLIAIEPAYALTTEIQRMACSVGEDRYSMFMRLSTEYANRYGINRNIGLEYYNQDILTNPNTEVKKLLKVIKK